MLSERERKTLAVLERRLREQDERAAVARPGARRSGPGRRGFAGGGRRGPCVPWLSLFVGMLAVLGTAIAGAPVVTLALICALLTGGAVALLVTSLRNWRANPR